MLLAYASSIIIIFSYRQGGSPKPTTAAPVLTIRYYICGGSILTPKFILTAASCTKNLLIKYSTVRAGSTLANEGGVSLKIAYIIAHAEYNPKSLNNDFSLIKLASSLEFSSKIQPIDLPDQDEPIHNNSLFYATGYGYTGKE